MRTVEGEGCLADPQIIPVKKQHELILSLESKSGGKVLDTSFCIDSLVKKARKLNKLQGKIDRGMQFDSLTGTARSFVDLVNRIKRAAGLKVNELGDLLKAEQELMAALCQDCVDIYTTFNQHYGTFANYRTKTNNRLSIMYDARPGLVERMSEAELQFGETESMLRGLEDDDPDFYLVRDNMWCSRDELREHKHKVDTLDYLAADMKETAIVVDNAAQVLQKGKHISEKLGLYCLYAEEKLRELGAGVVFANKFFSKTPEVVLIALSVSKSVNHACTLATDLRTMRALDIAVNKASALSGRQSYQLE